VQYLWAAKLFDRDPIYFHFFVTEECPELFTTFDMHSAYLLASVSWIYVHELGFECYC